MTTSSTDQFTQPHYRRLSDFALRFAAAHPGQPVDGEIYELPGTTVYHTHTQALAAKGRLEVNVVTNAATHAFEWRQEITLNNKADGEFIHVIVRHDGSAVETYGKTVLPITAARAKTILAAFNTALGQP